jgi:phage I-like protein
MHKGRFAAGLFIAALSGAVAAQSLALLAATMPLSAEIDAQGVGQAQLLPFGEFKARDGRPGPGKSWKLDDAGGRAIAASLNAIAKATPLVIDYDHQTLSATEKGIRAPAAGWINQVEWRDGKGLWATVKWTAAAKGHITAGEYLFISPVISYDDQGRITGVLMGALVNFPALLGMEPAVAALSAFSRTPHTPEPQMDRAALIALFGLAADATDAQINAAIAKLAGELPAMRAALSRPFLSAALATALGVATTADETAALSAVTQLRAATGGNDTAAQAIAALQGQLATLQARLNTDEVTGLVERAITEKRALPALRDWLTELGRKDVAQLKAFIEKSPVLDGLDGQSGGQERGNGGTAALAGEATKLMGAFGLSAEQFAKGKPATV